MMGGKAIQIGYIDPVKEKKFNTKKNHGIISF